MLLFNFGIILLAFLQIAVQRTNDGVKRPDLDITPGHVATVDTRKVCQPGYAESMRHVTKSMEDQVLTKYHMKRKSGVCCEIDHLVSLELGGSNEISNLWPQPYSPRPGAHEKDVLENKLHQLVCSGKLRLTEAQRSIATDWYASYQKYVQERSHRVIEPGPKR
jgi:hypothetical protein